MICLSLVGWPFFVVACASQGLLRYPSLRYALDASFFAQAESESAEYDSFFLIFFQVQRSDAWLVGKIGKMMIVSLSDIPLTRVALIITFCWLMQPPDEVWCQIGTSYQQDHPNHVMSTMGFRKPAAETMDPSFTATTQTTTGNSFCFYTQWF